MIRERLKAGLRRVFGRDAPPARPPVPSARTAAPPPATARDAEAETLALDPARIAGVIDDRIRPALRADGGDIELVAVVGADVHVRLQGACRGCPGAAMTLRMGVEALLREEFPGLGRVVDLT